MMVLLVSSLLSFTNVKGQSFNQPTNYKLQINPTLLGAIAGGGSAYTAGIQAKRGKIERKLGPALEATYNVADSVANMPTDTIAQRIAKSTSYQQKRYDASRGK